MDFFLILIWTSILGAVTAEFRVSLPPRLTPADEEHVIRTGETFTLICEASKPIEWKLPKLSHHLDGVMHDLPSRTTFTPMNQVTDGYTHRSRLQVVRAHYRDTGYFACFHSGADGDDHRALAKTYVYVQDDDHLIVSGDDEMLVSVVAHQSSREVIPCKPTSPNVVLTLFFMNEEINLVEGWSYDIHEGFVMEEVGFDMNGLYECNARHVDSPVDHVAQTLAFYVNVLPPTSVAPKPFINHTNATQVGLGDDFYLNCSASYDQGVTAELKWQVPHPDKIDGTRIRTGKLSSNTMQVSGMMQKVVYQVLYVTNANQNDEGPYECKAFDHTGKHDQDIVSIKIHSDGTAYVNISDDGLPTVPGAPAGTLEQYIVRANEPVKWIVRFQAYPSRSTSVVWSKNSEPIPENSNRYITVTRTQSTTLEMNSVSVADSADYQLTIRAGHVEKVRNFSLRVQDKPQVNAQLKNNVGNAVQSNERFEIRCKITSYPLPDSISVHFRECPPTRSCDPVWTLVWNSTKGSLQNTGRSNRNSELFRLSDSDFQTKKLEIDGTARVSGDYLCKACNELGCSLETGENRPRLVVTELSSRAKNGQELSRSRLDDPVVGEAFQLQCGASLYDFKSELSWWSTDSSGKSSPISLTKLPQGAKLIKLPRDYTYMEELSWDRIDKKAAGTYGCRPTSLKSNSSAVLNNTISFTVRDPKKPQVMNSSDTDVAVERNRELFLFCQSDGLPLPTTEWFKDGEPIISGVEKDPLNPGISKLSIQYANSSLSGSYECRAKNMAGSAERFFRVQILDPPVSPGLIAAIVVVLLIVIVLLFVLARKIRMEKKRKEFFRANQLDIFDKGNPESINPDLPIDEQTELLPYDRRWEFPRDRLKLGRQLGAGAFGRVLKGEATGIDPAEPVTTVAVKMIRSHGNMMGLKALMSELKIMIHMGSHLNVVNLLGACTKHVTKGELLVIVEYCRYGNIQNYLIRHRSSFINQVDHRGNLDSTIGAEKLAEASSNQDQLGYQVPKSPLGKIPDNLNPYDGGPNTVDTENSFLSMSPTGQNDLVDAGLDSNGHPTLTSAPSSSSNGPQSPTHNMPWRSNYRGDYRDEPDQKPLCTRDLICWSFQIARGMEYLARRKILHGDLAARNVLLSDENIVKIADFGLAREVYRSGNYKKKGEGPLPVKWMAIESILDRVFSTQSDVWSFGIVLWELFSLGKTPYPGMDANEQFFIRLQEGYRMDKPKYAPRQLYEVMQSCWDRDPVSRPDFTALSETLGSQLEASVRRHYMDLNDAYIDSHQTNGLATDYLAMMSSPDYVNVGGGSRPSPMPNRRSLSSPSYVNMPADPNRQSDYLAMGGKEGSPMTNEGANYLLMTSPTATSSSPNQPHFNFSPKLRKADQVDSVEMRPMLAPSSPTSPTTAFSNPNYQNPPPMKSSDLDDPPPPYQIPPNLHHHHNNKDHYVNISSAPPPEEMGGGEDERHYVIPKNNSLIV